MRATLSGVRPAAVTDVGPTNVAIPTVEGRGIIGRTRRTIPPRARKPHRATIQSAGRSRVAVTARASADTGQLGPGDCEGVEGAEGAALGAGLPPVSSSRFRRACWTSPISRPYVAKSPARSAAWASSKCVFA